MDKKIIIKIILDGEIIFSKPFLLNETLANIREKIKHRIKISFNFLDQDENLIVIENENNIILENIIKGNYINLKSIQDNEFLLKIFLNEKFIISLNCSTKDKLNKIRNLINNKIEMNFIFLDGDGNSIDIIDEEDFTIEDIVNNEIVKIKNNSLNDFMKKSLSMGIIKNDSYEKTNEAFNITQLINKKEIDFSKYDILKKRDDLTFYKYSNIQRKLSDKLVYQYFYDGFEEEYLNAYIILFWEKLEMVRQLQ